MPCGRKYTLEDINSLILVEDDGIHESILLLASQSLPNADKFWDLRHLPLTLFHSKTAPTLLGLQTFRDQMLALSTLVDSSP